MKLSLSIARNVPESAPLVLRGPYVETIRKAAQIGYDAVEIHVRDPRDLDLKEIIKVCKEEGVVVSTLGTGLGYVVDGLSLTHPEAKTRQEAADRLLAHVEAAARLGAGVIIGSMRGTVPDPGYAEEGLAVCLEKAGEYDVTLFLEAINRYETRFLNTAQDGLGFLSRFTSRFLKLHLDTFHMNIEEADMGGSIRKAGGALGHMHFADSNRRYPGQGHIDFQEVMAALKDIAYEGYIALECLPHPSPGEAAAGALKYLKDLIERT